jgi:predicted glutamine amidotransferase
MCRLLAFTAHEPPALTKPLVTGENSLFRLSLGNPDGAGVHLRGPDGDLYEAKDTCSARDSALLLSVIERANGVATSGIGHVRKMTQGGVSLKNTHPFSYGNWTIAHNGSFCVDDREREAILASIAPALHAHIQGETDSELGAYVFLTEVSQVSKDPDAPTPFEAARAMKATVETLGRITNAPGRTPAALNFVALNGATGSLVATRVNRQLVVSDHLGRPSSTFEVAPGAHTRNGLAVMSEPFARDLRMSEVPERCVVAAGVDSRLVVEDLNEDYLPLGLSDEARAAQGWTAAA